MSFDMLNNTFNFIDASNTFNYREDGGYYSKSLSLNMDLYDGVVFGLYYDNNFRTGWSYFHYHNINNNISSIYSYDSIMSEYYNYNSYQFTETQFTALADDVYGKIGYGLNGIAKGTLQTTNNLTINQFLRRTELYDSFSELTLEQNITNLSDAFKQKQYKYIPNCDTSNIVDMSGMFSRCYDLLMVPNFNTINVDNMSRHVFLLF